MRTCWMVVWCFLLLLVPVSASAQQTSTNATDSSCSPPSSYTVGVTLRPQETDMWCWAASGQMVMKTLRPRTNVTQCDEANKRFGLSECCNRPTPVKCVEGGWPEFSKYYFDSDIKKGPLDFSEVQQEIFCNKRPFAFSWHWVGGGGHMMVATGYQIVAGTKYIIKDDPWPPNQGQDSVAITYDFYVQGSDHTHWDDYYKVVPK
jgi:papain like cysteine protease AvrRpt2